MNANSEVINIRPISAAIELLREAYAIIEENANHPQNYNSIYAYDFEIKAWEIYRSTRDIQDISNRYGVL